MSIDFHKSHMILPLETSIFKCNKCPGLNIPKSTMSTPAYGSYGADLMVIGQSLHSYNPKTPDRQIPFIGPIQPDSGTILYDILLRAGFSFDNDNLLVTNLVKCHPPGNRASRLQEINNCAPYLHQEVELMNPKVILCLGADVREFFKFSPINRGYCYSRDWENRTFIIAHHPSYINRFGNSFIDLYKKELIDLIKIETSNLG